MKLFICHKKVAITFAVKKVTEEGGKPWYLLNQAAKSLQREQSIVQRVPNQGGESLQRRTKSFS